MSDAYDELRWTSMGSGRGAGRGAAPYHLRKLGGDRLFPRIFSGLSVAHPWNVRLAAHTGTLGEVEHECTGAFESLLS